LGAAQVELAPEVVHLPVIIHQGGGVDGVAVGTFDGYRVRKGAGGGIAGGNTLAVGSVAEEQIVAAVVIDAIGGEERGIAPIEAGIRGRGAEALAVVGPVNQVGGGEEAVLPTAVGGAAAEVEGAVQVEAAVGPLARFGVREEVLEGEEGVHGSVCVGVSDLLARNYIL
jgi:hypothetical protein